MKKLMIAVAMVCAAAYVQAANYTWGLGSGLDEDSSGNYLETDGFTVITLLGTVTESDQGEGKYTLDFSGVTGVLNSTSEVNGDYTVGSVEFDSNVKSDLVTQGTKQAYSILILEQGGVTDYAKYEGMYALLTGESSPEADAAEGDPFMNFSVADAVTADMYKTATAAVPEPTSGLLLLLGMAGLALKRKRA